VHIEHFGQLDMVALAQRITAHEDDHPRCDETFDSSGLAHIQSLFW